MELAGKFVYVPKEEEIEEIYEDEIIDGIAHCAMEQAQVLIHQGSTIVIIEYL